MNGSFALFSGSAGLFLALAVAKYLTRNVKWADVGEKTAALPESGAA